jgi:hypothetical protein
VKLNKYSFAAGNLFGAVVVGVVVVACGGGSGGSAGVTDYGTISASNVILGGGVQSAGVRDGIIRVQANQLPSNVQVLASNVSLVKASNNLKSTDLQTALDKEIAVDVGKTIVGVWDIQNVTSDSTYQGAWATGRVEFKSDGSYSISSGGFGAAGKVASGTGSFCAIPTSQTFTMVDGAVYFGADAGGDSVAIVAKSSSDAITLIGDGGCGSQGIARISKLTRVGVQQTAWKSPVRASKPFVMLTSY